VEADAGSASWVLLRLAKPLDQLFDRWLAEQFPERRERVLHRVRETRSAQGASTIRASAIAVAARASTRGRSRRFFGRRRRSTTSAGLSRSSTRRRFAGRRLPAISCRCFVTLVHDARDPILRDDRGIELRII
jgi:hypothetical protein